MDFFESQEVARRKSKTLVFYFVLAVLAVVLSIYAVAMVGNHWREGGHQHRHGMAAASPSLWDPQIFTWSSIGTLTVVLLGTGFKLMQLSGGGAVVARDLGGRRLDIASQDLDERKLLNVVEEMAIAAGVPVPEVYLMEAENGINAFAAGSNPSDAVIGVTRGCMRLLSRDELQGVIAHEFSHILNGDMRLNLRLIGLLHGILILAILGRVVAHGSARSGGKGAVPFVLFGLSLLLIGFVGVFFGKLIKAAVSRQREFLADASAVQFTRNPGGIGGALMKIGGVVRGSRLENAHAEEASHMFFANGMKASFASAFATHPPLEVRVREVLPNWDGKFLEVSMPKISAGWKAGDEGVAPGASPLAGGPIGGSATIAVDAAAVLEGMGQLDREQIEEGRRIHDEFSTNWVEALRHPSGAQAVIFAMLLAQDDDLRSQETSYLEKATDFVTLGETMRLHSELGGLHSSRKIALIDMAIPALRRLSSEEYERFLEIMKKLMESDEQIDLFEFTLQKIVRRHLDIYFRRARPRRIAHRKFADVAEEMGVLFSTLAYLGHRDNRRAAEETYRLVIVDLKSELGGSGPEMLAPEDCTLDVIGTALDRCDAATPLVKKRILHACGRSVMMDGEIRSDEVELLRAIADTIGCPIPPFVRA